MKKVITVQIKDSIDYLDRIYLLSGLVIIPLTWIFILGWPLGSTVSSHDTLPGMFVSLQSLFEHSGDWTQYLYRFDLVGGFKQHDITGCLPIYELCGWIGLSPTTCINLTVFLIQLTFGFLGIRAVTDLARFWQIRRLPEGERPRGDQLSIGSQLGLFWLIAFAPVMAWRLSYGHFFILTGCLFYMSSVALLLAARVQRLSLSLVIVSVIAIIHCFAASGYQSLLYSAVFGFPILLGLFFPEIFGTPKNRKEWGLALGTLGIGILLSLRHFAGLLDQARGTDGARSMDGESVIYSYLTASGRDWLSSLPWANGLIPYDREFGFWHEINYPVGPLAILLIFWSWRRYPKLAVGMLSSLVMVFLFSMNIAPFAEIFPKLVPLLNSFRVPARAILPLALTVPLVVAASCLDQWLRRGGGFNRKKWPFFVLLFGAIGFAVILNLCPPWVREILAVLATVALLIEIIDIPIEVVFIFFGLCSVFAFKERLLPFPSHEEIVQIPKQAGDSIRKKASELESSLVRAKFNFQLPLFHSNTGYSMGISTLDGYTAPSHRFLSLYAALRKEPIQKTMMTFNLAENDPLFPIFSQLYNVKYRIHLEQGQLAVYPLLSTLGQAWFSQSLEGVGSYAEGAELLQAPGDPLLNRLAHQAWIVKTDPIFTKISPPPLATALSSCQTAQVRSVNTQRGGQSVRVQLSTPIACPLTISTNWMSHFRAYAVKENGSPGDVLATYPVYGALTGVWVPASAHEIVVEAMPVLPFWANIGFSLGLILFLILIGIIYMRNHPISFK